MAKSTGFGRENRGNQPKSPGFSALNARKRSVIFGMVNETLNGMVHDVHYGKTVRKSYARHPEVLEMPYLLDVQKNSYQWFLDTGLREVFKDVAAITDYAGNLELSFIDYTMDEAPKYDVEECKARDATYAAPIKVRVRLRNKETEEIRSRRSLWGTSP